MKKIIALVFLGIIITACGGKDPQSIEDIIASNDLEQIRAKKSELDQKRLTLDNELKQLDDKIAELDPTQKVPLITTIKASEKVFNHFLELQGNVQTKQNVLIYPEMPGTLIRVYVSEGQRVSKGQLLATIDDGGLSSQVAQMEVQTELAKTTYDRQKRLWDQKIGSEIQFLQAKTSYESQKNALAQLKSQLSKSSIRAPFSGVIDDVMKEQGTVVAPGQGSEVFRIVNLNNMYIQTDVPESYINSVVKGKKVEVEFPVLSKTVDTKVRQAGNFINPANRTFKVEVSIPNIDKSIKPNLTAKLKINDYTNENALLIPQSIISEDSQGQQYIFVVDSIQKVNGYSQGIAKRIIIETGKTQGDVIEVLKGLENGAEIIQEGARSVKDNQKVRILDEEISE
ncbi:MAG: efflux RND transporter periplasmic adaptor subunit [Flavobacteriaceae bacterium]|nr:efflux RND transporter periplasmic adaptor subunit [Flavobacteriaceae bacterium]